GACDTGALGELHLDPRIRLHGFVEDLAPFYASADAAVVPLRAGGGTRIKILEAFAHGVPFVSTRIGAEGLGVVAGVHLHLADEVESFARACLDVKENPELRAALSTRPAALLQARYGTASIHAAIAEAYHGGVSEVRNPGRRIESPRGN